MPWVNPALFGGSGGSFDTLFEIEVNTGDGTSGITAQSFGGNTFSENGDPNNNFAPQTVATNSDSVEVNNLGNYLITVVSNTLTSEFTTGSISVDLRYHGYDNLLNQFQAGTGTQILRFIDNNVTQTTTGPITFNFTDLSALARIENHLNITFFATTVRPNVTGRLLLGFLKV
jgi:hypothetical protein